MHAKYMTSIEGVAVGGALGLVRLRVGRRAQREPLCFFAQNDEHQWVPRNIMFLCMD